MQHILDSQREPLRPKLMASALPLAATLLVALTLGLLNARQQHVIDAMQRERGQLAAVEAKATEFRLTLMAAQAKVAQLEKLAARLPESLGGDTVVRLGKCMPGDVWLSRVEITDRKRAFLQGASYMEAGVYDFVGWLQQAPGFAEVAIKRTQAASSPAGPTTSFELELKLGNSQPPATQVASHE
jgi:hypothetical protein